MIRAAFILCLMLFLSIGCETEIEVFRDSEPTPVVYCVLDQEQSIQTLRLSRSYKSLGASIPPDDSDSLLFDRAIDIILEQLKDGMVEKQSYFTPVDVTKDEGFFPVTTHWVYQTDMEITPNTSYQLIVYLNSYDKIVYGTCTTVAPFELLNPSFPEVRDIHLQPGYNPRYFWTPSSNAGVYQMGFIFHYNEYKEDRFEHKTMDFLFRTILMSESHDQYFTQTINSAKFYIQLGDQMTGDSTILRKCIGIEPYVLCGGNELADLIRLQQAGTSFNMLEYSNLANGIGVFSSRMKRQTGLFKLSDQTIDSLAYGALTKGLYFLDRHGLREGGGR